MSRRQIHPIASESLNTLLGQKAMTDTSFTVCELRDQLLEQPDLAAFDQKTLRLYVRDQINQRLKRGEVECVGLQPGFKQRELFRVADVFNTDDSALSLESDQTSSNSELLTARLRCDSEQLREQMEASDYRLQAFQEIVKKYPGARDEVVPLFEQEKAQARALGEKLKVYANVYRKLAEARGDA